MGHFVAKNLFEENKYLLINFKKLFYTSKLLMTVMSLDVNLVLKFNDTLLPLNFL